MKLSTILSILALAGSALASHAQTSPKVMPKSVSPKPEVLRRVPLAPSSRLLALGRPGLSFNVYREILDRRLGRAQQCMARVDVNPSPVLRRQSPASRLVEEEVTTLR